MALHIKKIKPLFTSLVTTGEKYNEDVKENGVIVLRKGDLKLYQKVIAVGSSVRDIQVGDTVMIDPTAYIKRKYSKESIQNDMDNNPIISVNFNWVLLDDESGNAQECLLLNDRDIKFVFEGEEKSENIIIPDNKIVLS